MVCAPAKRTDAPRTLGQALQNMAGPVPLQAHWGSCISVFAHPGLAGLLVPTLLRRLGGKKPGMAV